MACKISYKGQDSELYDKLEDQFGDSKVLDDLDQETDKFIKDEFHRMTRDPQFLQENGDFLGKNPEKTYKLKNADGSPRLYEIERLDDDTVIYGEPYIEDIIEYGKKLAGTTKEWNTGQFENAASKKINILQKAIKSIDLRIQKLQKERNKQRQAGKLKAFKKQLKDDIQNIADSEADRRLLQFAENALNQTVQSLKDLKFLIANLDVEGDPNIKKLNAEKLQDVYSYISTFIGIDDILSDIDKGYLEVPANVESALRIAQLKRNEIEGLYEKHGLDFVMKKFSTGREIVTSFQQDYYSRQYNKLSKQEKKELEKEGIKSKEDYVAAKIEEDKDVLDKRGDTMFRNMLQNTVNDDISILQRWLLAAMDVNDDVVRSLQFEISIVEDDIRTEWTKDVKSLDGIFKRLKAYKDKEKSSWVIGKDGAKKKSSNRSFEGFYGFMLERTEDGNLTGNFVARYRSSWSEEMDKVRKEIYSREGLTSEEKGKEWAKWKYRNTKLNWSALEKADPKKLTKYQKKYEKAQEAYRSEEGDNGLMLEFLDEVELILRDQHTQFIIPKNKVDEKKYSNPQYDQLLEYKESKSEDSVMWDYYNSYMNKRRKNDSILPSNRRLGYRLPAVRKGQMERFDEWRQTGSLKSFWKELIKPYIQEKTKWVSGTASERGEEMGGETKKERVVEIDAEGRTNQYIPIYYRGQVELEDLSLSLHDSLLYDTYTSLAYEKMSVLLPYTEMLLHFLKDRKTFTRTGINKLRGKDDTGLKEEAAINSYNLARDLVEDRMYGVKMLDPGYEVGGKSLLKILQAMQSYMSIVMLSGNIHSSIANWNLAQTLLSIEAVAGEHFGKRELAAAHQEWLMDTGNRMQDLTEVVSNKSKVNVLELEFDPLNNFDHRRFSYAHNNAYKQFLHKNSLHILNNSAEKHVQSLTMIAYLKGVKVKDQDGYYITKDGKRTSERNKGMNLYDSMTIKDGKIVYDDAIAEVEVKKGDLWVTQSYKSVEDKKTFNIRSTLAMQRINMQLHGAYSERNKMSFQRIIIGTFMIMFRKYLVPGFRTRYGGIAQTLRDYTPFIGNYAKGKLNENYIDIETGVPAASPTKMYDPLLGFVRSLGSYSTLYKFMGKMMSDLRTLKWQVMSENWKDLTDNEKSNVIRATSELALAMILPFIGQALAGKATDDDDDWYTGAFLAYRLSSELQQYTSFIELGRVVKNPAITVTFIERIFSLLGQGKTDIGNILTGDGPEVYKSGLRRGDYKIGKRFYDVVPFYKHATRNQYMKDVVSFYTETSQVR